MFDVREFLQAAAMNAAILTPLTLAIVTYLGKLGVAGKAQLAASMLVGAALGVSAQIASLGVPQDFAGWFALVLFGLVPGLTASGVYETGSHLANRAGLRAYQHLAEAQGEDYPIPFGG